MTNLIKNKKFTRIMAILLVVLIAFSTMFTLPVSAASGIRLQSLLIIVMTARAIQSNFSRQLSAMVTRSELPAKNCARFLQTEKKPTALNPVTACFQAIH
mgnify:CR=1 FL=1